MFGHRRPGLDLRDDRDVLGRPSRRAARARRSGARTNDCATKSAPRSSARERPSRSRSVTAAGRDARPGRSRLGRSERFRLRRTGSGRRRRRSPLDGQLDRAVGEQDAVALRRSAARPGYVVEAPRSSASPSGRSSNRCPGRNVNGSGRTVRQPHLRPGQIDEHGERLARRVLGLAHEPHHPCVLLGRAVREVQPEHRGPGPDQTLHELRRGARRSERADELRACHQAHSMSASRATTARASSSAAMGVERRLRERRRHRLAGASRRGLDPRTRGARRADRRRRRPSRRTYERPGARHDVRPPVAAAAGRDPPAARRRVRECRATRARASRYARVVSRSCASGSVCACRSPAGSRARRERSPRPRAARSLGQRLEPRVVAGAARATAR